MILVLHVIMLWLMTIMSGPWILPTHVIYTWNSNAHCHNDWKTIIKVTALINKIKETDGKHKYYTYCWCVTVFVKDQVRSSLATIDVWTKDSEISYELHVLTYTKITEKNDRKSYHHVVYRNRFWNAYGGLSWEQWLIGCSMSSCTAHMIEHLWGHEQL